MDILIILTISSIHVIGYGVERLLEIVADGRRKIFTNFAVRLILGALFLTISGLSGAKVIKNYSSYLVMVMITISLFIALVVLLSVDVITLIMALIIKLFDGK